MHPGYGFLSENVDFVEACEAKGIAFLGPTADTMRMFSRKHTAREFAAGAQCPVLPGAPGAWHHWGCSPVILCNKRKAGSNAVLQQNTELSESSVADRPRWKLGRVR